MSMCLTFIYRLRTARADLAKMGAIKALRKRKQFSKYATSAVQLNDTTVVSFDI